MRSQCFLLSFLLSWFIIANLNAEALPNIKIAVVVPNNSPYQAFASQIWQGALQAAQQINQQGGIQKRFLELVLVDDACDPKLAMSVAETLANDRDIIAVLGHVCSSCTLPASKFYEKAGKLVITPTSTHPEITERGNPTLFRMCGRDDMQAISLTNHLIKKLQSVRVVLIHDQDLYGKGLATAIQSAMSTIGTSPLLFENISRGQKDFRELVEKIKLNQADAIVFGGFYVEAGHLVRALLTEKVRIPFLSGDGLATREYLTQSGGIPYSKGTMMSFGSDLRKKEALSPLLQTLNNQGIEVDGYTLYAYSAIEAIAKAIQETGAIDGTQGLTMANWLHQNHVMTALGDKTWNAKGDLTEFEYHMYIWDHEGQYQEIQDPRK